MPGSFLCYTPVPDPPPVGPLPAALNGFVTFGSFNNLAKITPTVLSLWARILHRWVGSGHTNTLRYSTQQNKQHSTRIDPACSMPCIHRMFQGATCTPALFICTHSAFPRWLLHLPYTMVASHVLHIQPFACPCSRCNAPLTLSLSRCFCFSIPTSRHIPSAIPVRGSRPWRSSRATT